MTETPSACEAALSEPAPTGPATGRMTSAPDAMNCSVVVRPASVSEKLPIIEPF